MFHRSFWASSVLSLSSLACGIACGGGKAGPAAPAPPPVATPAPSVAPAAPPVTVAPSASAAPVVAPPPVFYLADGEVFRVEADGSSPTALHLTTDLGTGATVGVGSGGPLLSRDRRWLAFERDRDVWIARTDGAAPQQLTSYNKKGSKTGAEVLLAGFSPDSTRLLFHVDAIHCLEDCAPLPKGVTPGFELLELATMKRTPLPKVEGFEAFAADGKSVLHNKYVAASNYELRSYSLVDGSSRVVRTSKDPYGFSQLVVEGDQLAIVEQGAVMLGPVEGTTWTALTPKAPFAELQFPQLAPGGAHLAYARHLKGKASIEVVSTTQKGAPKEVCAACTARWHDATHLVAADAKGLRLIGLDGTSVPLAAKGKWIPIDRD